jgi:cytoskeletal protein RodZ
MEPNEMPFEEFFAERMKQKGFTPKKLADVTGISPHHLTEIMRNNFSALPSEPYVRGYLLRLGQALDFDGETWWQRVKTEGHVKNSGPTDALPSNRFLKKQPTKLIFGSIIVAIIAIYFIVQFPKILGKPTLTLTDPADNPATALVNPITLHGTVKNADTVSVNGDDVPLSPDGTWQKDVLLSSGSNTFDITAKKFLGGTTEINEEIFYQAPPAQPSTTTPSSTAPTSTPK